MKYSGIIYNDTANGLGIRTSLFVSGCRLHCKGCFNPECQDFNFGKEFDIFVEEEIIRSVNDIYHEGVSILGGEPLEPENAKVILDFVNKFIHQYGESKNIWLFTGYTYEYIKAHGNQDQYSLMNIVDILVDGPFIEDKKDLTLKFRGSSNQRIIDVKESYVKNKVIEMNI